MTREPQDDSWIWRPGIDRLDDVYDDSASDPPEDEEPGVWEEIGAISPSDPHYHEKFLRIADKARSWIEAYMARLPQVIRKQDVGRAFSDPRWLDQDSIQRRAENQQRVARQRAWARAADLDGYRKSEREGRAKRRKAQRLRRQVACTPVSVPGRAQRHRIDGAAEVS